MTNFTEEQLKIIKGHPNQSINVNAVPGSGKTTVMINRIAYMINHCKVNPKSIAMFTYNRSLGEDMTNKLNKLGIDSNKLFWCGTIHAFCMKASGDPHNLQPWIDRFSNSNLPKYTANGFSTSFDSRNELKYIIFDEYQDSSKDIADVIRILSKNRYLMIVGDSRQQLYAYRGADIKNLLSIKNDFVEYTLSETFRCNRNICALLNGLWNSESNKSAKIQSNIEGPKPILYRSRGSAMNNPNITNEIVGLINKYKDGSIAIISPTVNSDTAKRFLNDIHSNIFEKCKIDFDCAFESSLPEENSRGENKRKESKYIISSIHASKGLEYDTVIVLNVIDNKYFFDAPTYEARCKLFVASSRARQNLILFENNYHFTNGSIKWIAENDDLFNKPEDKIWNMPVRQRSGDINNKIEKNCRDYIRGFTNEQKMDLLTKYGPSEIIKTEMGLGEHVGNPALSGLLIELMFANKLFFDINFVFKPYITQTEWTSILRSKEIPTSIMQKIKKVYPYSDIDIKRKVEGGKVKIIILFIDKTKLLNSWHSVIDESMVETREITENHIVSDFMCSEYYKYLEPAHSIKNSIMTTDSCDEEYVENLWWLLRFQRLMNMSLTGFNQPDLSKEEIRRVLNYIEKAKILPELYVTEYHSHYRGRILGEEVETWVNGEADFECEDAIIELKCISGNELEEAWLQVMVYNQIAAMKYKKVYVYNAINGTLYQRKLKFNI
jgi:hypothetical protein